MITWMNKFIYDYMHTQTPTIFEFIYIYCPKRYFRDILPCYSFFAFTRIERESRKRFSCHRLYDENKVCFVVCLYSLSLHTKYQMRVSVWVFVRLLFSKRIIKIKIMNDASSSYIQIKMREREKERKRAKMPKTMVRIQLGLCECE